MAPTLKSQNSVYLRFCQEFNLRREVLLRLGMMELLVFHDGEVLVLSLIHI